MCPGHPSGRKSKGEKRANKTKRKSEKKKLAGDEGEGDRGQRNAKRRKDIGVYTEKRCCAVDRATVDLVS